MSTRYCHHVHENGALCQSPPVRHRDYCHFHLKEIGRRLRAARARARHQPLPLKLPLLEDPYAVQVALMQVADAIAYNEIDAPRARLLMQLLRLASSNLKTARAWEQQPLFTADDDAEAAGEWPGFEQEHALPAGFDLSVEPEVAFPPPEPGPQPEPEPDDSPLRARIRRALDDAQTPIAGTSFHMTADDMEIIEAYERGGDAAGQKKAEEVDRHRRRRYRRGERARYEELARNRNIQLAAQKLLRDERWRAQAEAEADKAAALRARAEAELRRSTASATSEASVAAGADVRKGPGSEAAAEAEKAASGTA